MNAKHLAKPPIVRAIASRHGVTLNYPMTREHLALIAETAPRSTTPEGMWTLAKRRTLQSVLPANFQLRH